MSRKEKKAAKAKQLAGVAEWSKRPQTAEDLDPPRKLPRSLDIEHDDVWQRRPVWRFGDLDMEAPSSVGDLRVEDFLDLHAKLAQYELQTCSEIWSQDNGCRKYELDSAHPNITDRLSELELDDETAVHTLRVNSRYRIFGILRQHVFYVLWLDRDHKMVPSNKKHT